MSVRLLAPVLMLTLAAALSPVASSGAAAEGAVPVQLVGRWGRTVSLHDAKHAHSTGITPGTRWTFVVAASSAATVGSPGVLTFTGHIKTVGTGTIRIALGPGAGVYHWHRAGNALTLTKQRDDTADRVAVFVGVWQRR